MEPARHNPATLVDLLDRVLDKGLVINADIIISLAGVPLIGVNLRAALAGMETMVRYGVMREWDGRIRAWEGEHRGMKKPTIGAGEGLILEMRGAYCAGQEAHATWRIGRICLTEKQLVLYHPILEGVLFQTPLDGISSLTMERDERLRGEERSDLCLWLEEGPMARLQAPDIGKLREAIEARMASLGAAPEAIVSLSTSGGRSA